MSGDRDVGQPDGGGPVSILLLVWLENSVGRRSKVMKWATMKQNRGRVTSSSQWPIDFSTSLLILG